MKLEEGNKVAEEKAFLGVKFDPHISVGHIVTTVCVIISGVTWAVNTGNRIERLEASDAEFKVTINEFRNDYKADLREIRQMFQAISDKIDKKADR